MIQAPPVGQMTAQEKIEPSQGLASAKPDRSADEINKSFGATLRGLRRKAGMTLDQLSTASNVSRAMISSVERGEKSPTLPVLSGIAAGLNVTISQLMGQTTTEPIATVVKRNQRMIFRDSETGVERHLLSPTHLATGVELVEHVLPPGQVFAGTRISGVTTSKYLIVRNGTLSVEIGTDTFTLEPEDSMHFQTTDHYTFANRSASTCAYYVLIIHKDTSP